MNWWLVMQAVRLRQLFATYDQPWQRGLAVASGVSLGILRPDNLFYAVMLMVMLCLPINLPLCGVVGLVIYLCSGLLVPVMDQVGESLLSAPALQPMWREIYSYPILRWTHFNNTVVLGSMAIASVAALPSYVVTLLATQSLHRARRLGESVELPAVPEFEPNPIGGVFRDMSKTQSDAIRALTYGTATASDPDAWERTLDVLSSALSEANRKETERIDFAHSEGHSQPGRVPAKIIRVDSPGWARTVDSSPKMPQVGDSGSIPLASAHLYQRATKTTSVGEVREVSRRHATLVAELSDTPGVASEPPYTRVDETALQRIPSALEDSAANTPEVGSGENPKTPRGSFDSTATIDTESKDRKTDAGVIDSVPVTNAVVTVPDPPESKILGQIGTVDSADSDQDHWMLDTLIEVIRLRESIPIQGTPGGFHESPMISDFVDFKSLVKPWEVRNIYSAETATETVDNPSVKSESNKSIHSIVPETDRGTMQGIAAPVSLTTNPVNTSTSIDSSGIASEKKGASTSSLDAAREPRRVEHGHAVHQESLHYLIRHLQSLRRETGE